MNKKVFSYQLTVSSFVKKIIKHPFFAGSIVMVVGSNLYNFGQFVYHFLAGRFLGKVYYGDLASLIAILAFVAIVQISLGLTVVKFVATEKKKTALFNFTKWVNWWTIWVGLGAATLTFIFSGAITSFLNISQPLTVYLLGPTLLFFILTNTGRSILQGNLLFNKYVLSLLVEVGVKIILTLILIAAGFALFGAFFALFVGIALSFLVTRISLSSYVAGARGKMPKIAPLLSYSFPVFIQGLALTSMYSTDLVLVKHFFRPEEAGIYASLAVMGRIVFFGASPVTHTMFPIVARRFSHGQPYHKIFYLAILLVGGIAGFITLIYFLFPKFPLGILYGEEFLAGSPYLWLFGVFMTLLAFAMLFTQFYLSVGKTRIVWLFVLAAVAQAVLIWFIHSDIATVIQLSILAVTLLDVLLLLYFPYHHRK